MVSFLRRRWDTRYPMYLNMASIFFKCLFLSIFRITSGLPYVTEGVEGNLQYESIII